MPRLDPGIHHFCSVDGLPGQGPAMTNRRADAAAASDQNLAALAQWVVRSWGRTGASATPAAFACLARRPLAITFSISTASENAMAA